MASRPHLSHADSTGSFILAQLPSRLSLGSAVLASTIKLPPGATISYSIFTAPAAQAGAISLEHTETLEQARRQVWRANETRSVSESLLPTVQITRESLSLYVFALGSSELASHAQSVLQKLTLDGLHLTDSGQFKLEGLYPCSSACSTRITPCAACLDKSNAASMTFPGYSPRAGSECMLPRAPLRHIYTQFLAALRDRLIDDIVQASGPASTAKDFSGCARSAVRLKDGLLIQSPTSLSSSDWGAGWSQRHSLRTLTHCRLRIEVNASRILVHPVLRPTWYLPLSSLPVPAGTPVVLLPQGVPAYFLSTYTGPSGGLTTQFERAFAGLGAGHWNSSSDSAPSKATGIQYVVVWVAVQNKQGEDKGVLAIWPFSRCVMFCHNAPVAPPPLAYIPVLPAQLQPSPPPIAIAPPSSPTGGLQGLTPSLTAPSTPSASADLPIATGRATPGLFDGRHTSLRPNRSLQPPHSPSSDSLRAFKSLTLNNRDLSAVAGEVSGFADAVAKEREKERERLRRERDGSGASSRNVSVASIPPKPPPPARTTKVTPSSSLPTAKASPAEAEVEVEVDHDGSNSSLFSEASSVANTPTHTGVTARTEPIGDTAQNQATSPPSPNLLPAPEILPGSPRQASDESMAVDTETPPAPSPDQDQPVEAAPRFDSFNGFENGWGPSSNEFLGMDMGGFGLDTEYSMSMDVDGDASSGFGVGGEFNPFTDDDFSFFDAPSARPAPAPTLRNAPAVPSQSHSALTSTALGPPVPAPVVAGHNPSISWSQGLPDGLTPRSMDAATPSLPPPDLIPTTPTLTPPSHSLPVTPTVMLSDRPPPAGLSQVFTGPTLFDPIPFAEAHKLIDDKYAMGKFALPTPSDDEDRAQIKILPLLSPRGPKSDWYTAATDPRVGIINMLKRKRCKEKDKDEPCGRRGSPPVWAWSTESEEWASSPSQLDDGDIEDSRSDSSEDENDGEDEEEDTKDFTSSSRSYTPPPAYLPPGPSLVPTHFSHPYMLALSTPLRPPGVILTVAPGAIGGPMYVPTPVSPAAILGDIAEKSKALEDAARMLARELIENCVWESAWRANASVEGPRKPVGKVWQVDVQCVRRLMDQAGWGSGLEKEKGAASLGTALSDQESASIIEELDAPTVAVGKSDTIIQISPTALRFWEKLGLTPRAGAKDVNAFVLYEGSDDEKENRIAAWLEKLSQAYSARKYGTQTAARTPSCVRAGLAPIHFDTFRKGLSEHNAFFSTGTHPTQCPIASFISTLPQPERATVFYIVLPTSSISLSSPVLRRALAAVRRAQKNSQNVSRVFQLVPEAFVMGALNDPMMSFSGLELLASSVYDRLRVPASRSMSRSFNIEAETPTHALFQEPAFVLSGRTTKKAHFARVPHPYTLDVLDCQRLLHVAYTVSPCGKWLFAASIDQAGMAHDVHCWLLPSEGVESFTTGTVWEFGLQMALKANVLWHVAVVRLGFMSSGEFDAWNSVLDPESLARSGTPLQRVTLVVAEAERLWHFVHPEHSSGAKAPASPNRTAKVSSTAAFSDVSATTYLYRSGTWCTLAPPSAPQTFGGLAHIQDPEDEKATESLGMRPLATTALIRVPAGSDLTAISTLRLHLLASCALTPITAESTSDDDILGGIARDYHDLAVLSHERWHLRTNRVLPFHLAALDIMQQSLERPETCFD